MAKSDSDVRIGRISRGAWTVAVADRRRVRRPAGTAGRLLDHSRPPGLLGALAACYLIRRLEVPHNPRAHPASKPLASQPTTNVRASENLPSSRRISRDGGVPGVRKVGLVTRTQVPPRKAQLIRLKKSSRMLPFKTTRHREELGKPRWDQRSTT